MKQAALPRLVALSPGDLRVEAAPQFIRAVQAASAAGLPALLLREPQWNDRDLVALCHALSPLRTSTELWIHDRVHVARALNLDGVHLGFRSLPLEVAAPCVLPSMRLGYSSHMHEVGLELAHAQYLFLSPVYPTESKRAWLECIGLEGLRQGVQAHRQPVFALGGIRLEHMPQLLASGAHGVALRSAIFAAANPAAQVAAFLEALEQAR